MPDELLLEADHELAPIWSPRIYTNPGDRHEAFVALPVCPRQGTGKGLWCNALIPSTIRYLDSSKIVCIELNCSPISFSQLRVSVLDAIPDGLLFRTHIAWHHRKP